MEMQSLMEENNELYVFILGKKDKKGKKKDKDKKGKKGKKDKKDKKGKKDKNKKGNDKKEKKKDDGKDKKKKKQLKAEEAERLTKARERSTLKLTNRLEIKKRIVDAWDKSPNTSFTSPAELADFLESLEILPALLAAWQAGDHRKPKARKLSSRVQDSAVNLNKLTDSLRRSLGEELFRFFDLNQDGQVDQREVILVLSALVTSDSHELNEFHFLILDKNHDGSLSAKELKILLRLKLTTLKVLFELDVNENMSELGSSEQEINKCKEMVHKQVFDNPDLVDIALYSLLRHADANNDDLISLDEYQSWTENPEAIEQFDKDVSRLFKRKVDEQEYPSKAMQQLVRRSLKHIANSL